jgi:hypothetical protein
VKYILRHVLNVLRMATLTAAMSDGDDIPPFKITTKRDDDRVEMKAGKDKVAFSVHSPFGISHAVIERSGETWPTAVVVRLHPKGLENFRVTIDKVKLKASVSSQDGTARVWKDGKEDEPIGAKSPYRMAIRMIDKDGKPTTAIPLQDGLFELSLPRAFFDGNPKSIELNWTDFYRNCRSEGLTKPRAPYSASLLVRTP